MSALPGPGSGGFEEDFVDSAARGTMDIGRQVFVGIKPLLCDFGICGRDGRLLPAPYDKEGNMISWEPSKVCVDTKELRLVFDDDTCFFPELANESVGCGFVAFHASTREVPAGAVGVPDQKDAIVGCEHHALGTERHTSRPPPVSLHKF